MRGTFKRIYQGSIKGLGFRASENEGYLLWGVLIIRILLFRVLYWGPLFSETPHP